MYVIASAYVSKSIYMYMQVYNGCMYGKSGERHNELRDAVKRGAFLE